MPIIYRYRYRYRYRYWDIDMIIRRGRRRGRGRRGTIKNNKNDQKEIGKWDWKQKQNKKIEVNNTYRQPGHVSKEMLIMFMVISQIHSENGAHKASSADTQGTNRNASISNQKLISRCVESE